MISSNSCNVYSILSGEIGYTNSSNSCNAYSTREVCIETSGDETDDRNERFVKSKKNLFYVMFVLILEINDYLEKPFTPI